MLKEYNDLPDEQRYPVVVPARERMPTPFRRVRMRRKAGLTVHWDDYPDSKFFGYDPMDSSDDEDEDAPSPPRVPGGVATMDAEAEAPPRSGSEARAVPEPEAESVQPKAKRRLVRRGTTKTRIRYEGSFRIPRYRFDFVHRYGNPLVRSYTAHAHHTFSMFLFIYCLFARFLLIVVDYNTGRCIS